MKKILKFDTNKQNVWFSSDWHVYHNPVHWNIPIWKQRGYLSLDESVSKILDELNLKINSNDILIFLGDGFLNSDVDMVCSFFKRINCLNIYYLWGNHESTTYKIYKKQIEQQTFNNKYEIYPLRYDNVIFVGNYLELSVNKQGIVCSHFPMRIWNHSHHSAWSLSGHSHYNDEERRANYPNYKSLDVGWDGKLSPYSFDEIKEIMNNKKIINIDHRDENTN